MHLRVFRVAVKVVSVCELKSHTPLAALGKPINHPAAITVRSARRAPSNSTTIVIGLERALAYEITTLSTGI